MDGKLQFVLIDLDDTIFDFKAAERNAFMSAMRVLGLTPDASWAARYSEINAEEWRKLERGEIVRERVKIERFERLAEELGLGFDARKAAAEYEPRLMRECPLMPGAERFLSEASALFELYAISNGSARVQSSRLDISGIRRYFRGIFISETVGFDKPDPRFFRAVTAAIAGFDPGRAAVVGDSPTSDIGGGRAAGLRTVLVGSAECAEPPDHRVKNLGELLELLKTL